MNANQTPLLPLLEGVKQYVVPLFQRKYNWTRKDWETLWQDLIELYESTDNREHFLGAIVTMPVDMSPHGINKYLLIDGQQRLTTVYLLLALIRDLVTDKDARHAAQINELYLLNKWEEGPNRYKVLPTQADRAAFFAILDGKPGHDHSAIQNAAIYLRRKLTNTHTSDGASLDLRRLHTIMLQRLVVVSIVMDRNENPYRIFESLNGKGQPLTQADLVRNYVFMRISNIDEQNVAYKELWQPMETNLDKELTNFFWRYLTKDGTFVRQNMIYDAVKNRLSGLGASGVIDELLTMRQYADYYLRLIQPKHEPNPQIRRRLQRLNLWEINTAYPFLLNIYDDYEHRRISLPDMCEVLDAIESYTVRRFFCRVPTNMLNRLFIALYRSVDPANIVASTQEQMLQRSWPTDQEFLAAWEHFPIYASGVAKCRHILESLEATMTNNHEPVDLSHPRITIEHIMPQTLNEIWEEQLGQTATQVYDTYLHTIGNLTLTGRNESMGNMQFSAKKLVFAQSNLALNKDFANCTVWTEPSIRERAAKLGQIALRIWQRPSSISATINHDDPTGQKPIKFMLFGEQYPVQKWRDILVNVCAILAAKHGAAFAAMAVQASGTTRQYVSTNKDDLAVPALIKDTNLWVETNLSSRNVLRVVELLLFTCGHDKSQFHAFW